MGLLRVLAAGAALLVSFADMASAQIIFRRGTIASVSTAANAIIIYDQQGNVQTAIQSPLLNLPTDLAFAPDGTLLVVSSGDNLIRRVGLAGEMLETISDAQCPSPRGVAVGPEGDIFVTTQITGMVPSAVCRFSHDGIFETALASGDMNAPRGLTFAPNGNCYVCDYTAGLIREFDACWRPLRTFTDPGFSIWPTSIVFDSNGDFHVASRVPARVYTFTIGYLPTSFSLTSDSISGITLNGNGDILTARETSGTLGIYSFGVETNAIFAPIGAAPSGSIAIAPHRFSARVKGRTDTPFGSAQPINEIVDVTISPGTGRVTVRFFDGPSATDFSSVIGVPYIVADGRFGSLQPGETKRYLTANEIYESSSYQLTTASIAGEVTGTWNPGFFSPTRAKLTLNFSRGSSTFVGKITTLQLLP